ncbi:MAG: hypothetical protein FWC03_03460 [Treponema sp.]|nr:hypothetical protein [Treponema sp.]
MKLSAALFPVFFMLILSACSDIFTPQNDAESGLKIILQGAAIDARTLIPDDPDIARYILYFTHQEADPSSHGNIILENGVTEVLVEELALGVWTVTATGYITVSGIDYAVVRGSADITIASRVRGTLNITVNAIQESYSAYGTLSYLITYPETRANNGNIYIYPINDSSYIENRYFYSSNSSGTISLPPNFYRMVVELYDGYRNVRRSEIIHIYQNLETKAELTFTNDDFIDVITLGGTLNVTVGGRSPETVYMYIYMTMNDGGNYPIGFSYIDNNNKSWSMVHPAFDSDVPLYFDVTAVYGGDYYYKRIDTAETLKNVNKTINLGTVDIPVITLSGTVTGSYGGSQSQISYIEINISDSVYGKSRSVLLSTPRSNNNWSIIMQAFDGPTEISYSVTGYQRFSDGINEYTESLALPVSSFQNYTPAHNQDVSGINLNAGNAPSVVPSGIPALAAGTWVNFDNSVTASSGIDWYEINVTAGTTYYLWWNERSYGNYTRTLDVQVTAMDSNETMVYFVNRDTAWNSYASFTAGNSGTVYIRVQQTSYVSTPGTYGIVYNNTGTRPSAGNNFISGSRTPLTSGGWTDGEITSSTSGGEIWYSIDAAPGTYYIWWNHAWEGNYFKNLYADVTAWYENGEPIFNDKYAFNSPKTVNVSSSSTICIRVRASEGYSSTGTFSIAYNTSGSKPFVDPSGGQAAMLVSGAWTNGGITSVTNNGENWYYFNVSQGTTYYLWWNDSYQGNSLKTMNISVSAWSGDGSQLYSGYDSAWDNPASYTAYSNGRVYIRVNGYNMGSTGTYGIAYNASGNKPDVDPSQGQASALANNVWKNEAISAAYEVDWYSLNVTAGVNYNFWWNDLNDGNSTKSLNIDVAAWYSDGTFIFNPRVWDSAWNYPVSFTAGSSETIYIRVRAYNGEGSTGDYGLVYSTGGSRPGDN